MFGLRDLLCEREISLPPGYSAKLLDLSHLSILNQFRRDIVAGLSNPDHYRIEVEPANFTADHIQGGGITVGIFHNLRMVGYGALGLPRSADMNRGRDFELGDDQLLRVAHMASAMVSPEARRLKLHRWLIETRLNFADHLGRRHIFATVSPMNDGSWANLATYSIYPRRLIDTGLGQAARRFLLYRDIHESLELSTDSARLLPLERLTAIWDSLPDETLVWSRLVIGGQKYAVVGLPSN